MSAAPQNTSGAARPQLRNWTPPLLRGENLRQWAYGVTEVTTIQRLAAPRNTGVAQALAFEILEGVSHAIDQSPDRSRRECQAGCPGCCHARVSVTPLEAIAIAGDVRDRQSPAQAVLVRQRAEENIAKTAALDDVQYAASMTWCPLLAADLTCSVYHARPIVCRAWHSLSREQCRECYFSNHVTCAIPLDQHAYTVGQGARAGLAAGLNSAGVDGREYELNSALLAALTGGDVAQRWLSGAGVFDDCQRA